MQPGQRLHYMDHLRALAMLAGVGFHAALAYSPMMRSLFPTADRQDSPWVDAVIWLPHLFRMSLFFAVSGFFAALILARSGGLGLARQRLRRIAVPFVVALPIVLWTLSASTEWAASHVAHPSSILQLIRYWQGRPDAPQLPPSTTYLWFLYYLLWFGVLHWIVRTLEVSMSWLMRAFASPGRVLLGLPLVLTPALALVSAPFPAPDGWLPQFWALLYYGAFYAFGVQLFAQPDWLQKASRYLGHMLGLSTLMYALFLLCLQNPTPTASWPVAWLEACIGTWLTVSSLVLGQRLLDRPNPALRYLSRSSYWIYLLHLPVLFVIQYRLMDLDWPWGIKFAAACAATLAACLLSYQYLVRKTPLARFVG